MADSTGNLPTPPPPGRTGPVLVPQAALQGKPDISLARSVITVGARESCRIHLVSRSVSQYHALFVNSSGTVSVFDLASRTGVQVNGKAVKYQELKTGDRVQIGKFLFRFRAPRPDAVAAPPTESILDVPGDLPVRLNANRLLIGRRETCDLPLTDDLDVSTLHAIVFPHDGNWIVRDLESRTGTRLNGIRVHQAKLAFGDVLMIGTSRFVFSPAAEVFGSPADDGVADPDVARVEPTTAAEIPSFEPTLIEPPAFAGTTAEAGDEVDAETIDASTLLATAGDTLVKPDTVPPLESIGLDAPLDLLSVPVEAPISTAVLSNRSQPTALEPLELEDLPEERRPSEAIADVAGSEHRDNRIELNAVDNAGGEIELAPASELHGIVNVPEAFPSASAQEPPISDAFDTDPADASTAEAVAPGVHADVQTEPHESRALADAIHADSANSSPPINTVENVPAIREPLADGVADDFQGAEDPPPLPPPSPLPLPPLIVDELEADERPETSSDRLPLDAVAVDDIPVLDVLSSTASTRPTDELALSRDEVAADVATPLNPSEGSLEPSVETESETVDFGDSEPPPIDTEAPKSRRKRTSKAKTTELPASIDLAPPAKKPRMPRRRKSVTPVVLDVVETIATAPPDTVAVESTAALLPEMAAAIELGEGLPEIESLDASALLNLPVELTAADEPSLTMTQSLPVERSTEDAVVTVSDTSPEQSVTSTDLSDLPAKDAITAEISSLSTESLPVEHADLIAIGQFAQPGFDDKSGMSVGDALETSLSPDQPAALHAVSNLDYSDLAEASSTDTFVPVSVDEPGEVEITEPPPWPAEDSLLDVPDQSSHSDEPPASHTSDGRPVIEPEMETFDAASILDEEQPAGHVEPAGRPPAFGFDFGGGSFLGGMPLTLEPPPPTFGKAGYAFDAPAGVPTSLAAALEERNPRAGDAAPADPTPTAPAALVEIDDDALLSFDNAPNGSAAPPTPVMLTPSQSAPPKPLPQTPGRQGISTLANEVAIPPMVERIAPHANPGRPNLTTAFDGLSGGLGATNNGLNVDVFSQMAPPIRDEQFGSRAENPDSVVLPSAQPQIPPAAPRRDPPLQIPPATDRSGAARPATAPPSSAPGAQPVNPSAHDRFGRVPLLVLSLLLSLVAAGMAIYFFLAPAIEVRGVLSFENLSKQPVPVQRSFAINQVQRLESADVRNRARASLQLKGINPGFIDSDLDYTRVATGSDWSEEKLTLRYVADNDYTGRARLAAVLEGLVGKDADLNDALARAKQDASAAAQKVQDQQRDIATIRAEREAQIHVGDSSPRPQDVALLEQKATRLDAEWVVTKTRRADAQAILDKLRHGDPNIATDPRDDPLLTGLKAHLQQLDAALSTARGDAARGIQTDVDPALLAADIEKIKSAIASRTAVLSAERDQTPEQRRASRQEAIEAQSVLLSTLQEAEASAGIAAQDAAVRARDQRAALDSGRMASIKVEDLIGRQQLAERKLRDLSEDQAAKDNVVSRSVRVADRPQIDTQPGRDIRPVTASLTALVIGLIFTGLFIALTRPAAPAPMLSPAAAIVAEPIPVFGTQRRAKRPQPTPQPSPPEA